MRTRTRIVVAGDIHLGKRQYNHPAREKDFQDAWLWVCKTAAEAGPDFFILTGDLFDKKVVDQVTLSCAIEGLSTPGLGIVLAVEGNHDGRSYISKGRSWLEFLADQGHVDHVLRANDPYRDDGGILFCGSPWTGRRTEEAFEGMAWDAEIGGGDNDFRIGVIHAAPENYVPGIGGIPAETLGSSWLDMVFMGHCHRPFNIGDRVLCGGSPEICDIGEIDTPGGLWTVDIDLVSRRYYVKFIGYDPRPFTRLWFDSHDIVSDGTREILYKFGSPPFACEPVVIIDVGGKRVPIDMLALLNNVQAVLKPLLVRINDKMDARPLSQKKASGPESFRESVEPLLEGVSFDEFVSVFDCFEKQDSDAVESALMEDNDDK